jgi:integrase
MLSLGEAISIFTACNAGTKAGGRDAVMFAVACGAGPRRAESAKLTLADYNEAETKITVRKGKRNKTRTVPLPPGTIEALARWLALPRASSSAWPLWHCSFAVLRLAVPGSDRHLVTIRHSFS